MKIARFLAYLCFAAFSAAALTIAWFADSAPFFQSCMTAQSAGYRNDLAPGLDELIRSRAICSAPAFNEYALPLAILFLAACLLFLLAWSLRTHPTTERENEMQKMSNIVPHRPAALRNLETSGGNSPPSIISAGVTLVGNIHGTGDFQIDGAVDGDITCSGLVISDSGRVVGDVYAEKILVRGQVRGHLQANHVILSNGCDVEATIEQKSLRSKPVPSLSARFVACKSPLNPPTWTFRSPPNPVQIWTPYRVNRARSLHALNAKRYHHRCRTYSTARSRSICLPR